jgi:hypothetical protein
MGKQRVTVKTTVLFKNPITYFLYRTLKRNLAPEYVFFFFLQLSQKYLLEVVFSIIPLHKHTYATFRS